LYAKKATELDFVLCTEAVVTLGCKQCCTQKTIHKLRAKIYYLKQACDIFCSTITQTDDGEFDCHEVSQAIEEVQDYFQVFDAY